MRGRGVFATKLRADEPVFSGGCVNEEGITCVRGRGVFATKLRADEPVFSGMSYVLYEEAITCERIAPERWPPSSPSVTHPPLPSTPCSPFPPLFPQRAGEPSPWACSPSSTSMKSSGARAEEVEEEEEEQQQASF